MLKIGDIVKITMPMTRNWKDLKKGTTGEIISMIPDSVATLGEPEFLIRTNLPCDYSADGKFRFACRESLLTLIVSQSDAAEQTVRAVEVSCPKHECEFIDPGFGHELWCKHDGCKDSKPKFAR